MEPTATVVPSSGLLVAPFGDGAAVYDPAAERAHLLGRLAAWLVLNEEPADLSALTTRLVAETGTAYATAHSALVAATATLTDLGLLGRTDPVDVPASRVPRVGEPEPGWFVGDTHGIPGGYLAFCGPDRELIDAVDELLGAPVTGTEPTVHFALVPHESGDIDLIGDTVWRFEEMRWLLWQLPSIINDAVAHSDAMAVLHAGAVRTPDGRIVVVTGPMNTGKSTLVAALIRAGCDYLGDESLGIASATTQVWAYPKPLTLDPTSQRIVGLDPVGEPATPGEHRRAAEIRPGANSLTGEVGPIDLVVHTAYRPDAQANRTILGPAQSMELLLTNTLNLLRAGPDGFATLCHLAETVPVVSIIHGDTLATADRIVAAGADPERLVALSPEERRAPLRRFDPGVAPGHWWFDWYGVTVSPSALVRTIPVVGGALAVVPGRESRVLDAISTAVLRGASDQSFLAEIVEKLEGDSDDIDDRLRFDVVNGARRLAAAELVTLDRHPRIELPVPEPDVDGSSGRRMLPRDPAQVFPPSVLEDPSAARSSSDPDRQPGEEPIGSVTVQGPDGRRSVPVATNVSGFRDWLGSLPDVVVPPDPSPDLDDDDGVRVLDLPGEATGTALIAHRCVTLGPVPHDELPDEFCRALTRIVGSEPPDGYRIGSAWVADASGGRRVFCEAPDAPVLDDDAHFVGDVWAARDGTSTWELDVDIVRGRLEDADRVVPDIASADCWRRVPLERIVLGDDVEGAADAIAALLDVLRLGTSGSLDTVAELASTLVSRSRIDFRPATEVPAGEDHPPVPMGELTELGRIDEYGKSVKMTANGIGYDRWLWTWQPHSEQTPETWRAAAGFIADFATGKDVAEAIVDLPGHDGTFLFGGERDRAGRTHSHKVYVELSERSTWEALAAMFPDLVTLYDSTVLSTGEDDRPPAFVAWKHVQSRDRRILSVYRQAGSAGCSVGDAITRVLPGRPEWVAPASALIGLDRDLDGPLGSKDLEVVEAGGRCSIDLDVPIPRTRGARAASAHWLAALAGLDPPSAQRWVDHMTRWGHFRLIVGTDNSGEPFFSTYHR